jgi:phage terminase small subunit
MKTTKRILTIRQENFISEYLKDGNATQAALRAGYSPKTSYSIGQRLLKDVEINQQITELQKQITDTALNTALVTKEMVIKGILAETKAENHPSVKLKAWELLGKTQAIFQENLNVTEKLDPEMEKALRDFKANRNKKG